MDRFRIISKLGAGGFGEAFRAWDRENGVPVVLKRPLAKHLQRPDVLARFDREITRLLELSHPSIVPIIHHGRDAAGLPYLAMRFLPAGSLADRKKPHPISFLHRWLPSVATALDYVHARGVVHRDVKPANIFFDTESHAYLGDFGIAKIIDDELAEESEHSLTSTGGEIGTYPYMGPEFFRKPRVLSGAYDQYALAVTVYEMICGRRPFSGDSGQLIVAHVTQAPPDIRGLQADVPESLCNAVYRALAKRPDDRFPTCSSFAQAVLRDVPLAQVVDSHQRFLCPSCHKLVRVPVDLSGRTCRCPDCNVLLRVSPNSDALWRREEDPTDKRSLNPEIPARLQSTIRNSVGMTLSLIPAGTFMMGSESDPSARPMHPIRISREFYLAQTPVTQEQWIRVMSDSPSTHTDPSLPVTMISWYEAVVFCKKLSNRPEEKAAGRAYRLPTEAEWEYSCRARSTTAFACGEDPTQLIEYAWFDVSDLAEKYWRDEWGEDHSAFLAVYGSNGTRTVGTKRPNSWGLFDMHGNVSEWCMDWFGEYQADDAIDPSGLVDGQEKVSRGGSWMSAAHRCASAARQHQPPDWRLPVTSFRVACTCPSLSQGERGESLRPTPLPNKRSAEGTASDQQQDEERTEKESLASSRLARRAKHGARELGVDPFGKSLLRATSDPKPILRSNATDSRKYRDHAKRALRCTLAFGAVASSVVAAVSTSVISSELGFASLIVLLGAWIVLVVAFAAGMK